MERSDLDDEVFGHFISVMDLNNVYIEPFEPKGAGDVDERIRNLMEDEDRSRLIMEYGRPKDELRRPIGIYADKLDGGGVYAIVLCIPNRDYVQSTIAGLNRKGLLMLDRTRLKGVLNGKDTVSDQLDRLRPDRKRDL